MNKTIGMIGRHRHLAAQRGFTLIEVLISLIILSIGLLGLAGLQTTSLQANQSALHTSQANQLAYDIVDRMRANRQVASQNAYKIAIGDPLPPASTQPGRDLRRWNELIEQLLPQHTSAREQRSLGSIVVNDNMVLVTIQWSIRSASSDATNKEEAEELIRQTTLSSQL